jgi:hypothetical protein
MLEVSKNNNIIETITGTKLNIDKNVKVYGEASTSEDIFETM